MQFRNAWVRRFWLLFGGLVALGADIAVAEPPAPDDPARWVGIRESLLREELEAAGTAVREHLTHTADGDFIGAALAARDAQRHRDRYLDLRRELAHGVAGSVHAPTERNPFAPGDEWFLPRMTLPESRSPTSMEHQGSWKRHTAAHWDIYAHPSSGAPTPDRIGAPLSPAWGMYGVSALPAREAGQTPRSMAGETSLEPSTSEQASRPYEVLRAPAGSTPDPSSSHPTYFNRTESTQ